MRLVIEWVGYAASAGAASMWLPQAWRVLRLRHARTALAGISIASYAIGGIFNALLLVYGIGTHSTPVVLAGGINVLLTIEIVTTVSWARRAA